MRLIPAILAAALFAAPALASDSIVSKTSPHDVATTVENLKGVLDKKGIGLVAEHDHSAKATDAGMTLTPATVLIFGNPKNGTPILQENPAIGLDLPMRVLIFQNADGDTEVIYHNPEALAEAHGIDPQMENVQNAKGALDGLTNAAIAE